MSVVQLRGVSRWYGKVLGVIGVDLELGPGVIGLLGPNGAGKSTLMKLIAGEIRPSHGRVLVFGEEPFANPRVAAHLGVAPEGDGLYPQVSGREQLEYFLRLHGSGAAEARDRAATALTQLKLEQAADRRFASYSRGMRQRLKLAQAIAHRPALLLLDEPLSGLDPVGRRDVIELIRREAGRGATVLVSSHILHEIEMMTRDVILMSQGRVLATGNVHEIRRLIDAHPHRIRIGTHSPRDLAARLIAFSGVKSISFSEERNEVLVETVNPEPFYRHVAEVVLDEGIAVDEIDSPDDNLESVFRYLVG